MTPEEQVMYSFLEYSIKVLEEQIKTSKPEDGDLEDKLEYERQVKVLSTLKQKIKELKK
jgi:hypothetical protein